MINCSTALLHRNLTRNQIMRILGWIPESSNPETGQKHNRFDTVRSNQVNYGGEGQKTKNPKITAAVLESHPEN